MYNFYGKLTYKNTILKLVLVDVSFLSRRLSIFSLSLIKNAR